MHASGTTCAMASSAPQSSASADPLMLGEYPKVTGAQLKELQKRFLALMDQDADDSTKFPGAQPVSFERKHLAPPTPAGGPPHASLLAAPYFAAEKTDGVRYMLLILGEKGTFAVDRNFEMRSMPRMRFPTRADPQAHLDSTLLDGELVEDALGARKRRRDEPAEPAGSTRLRYLVYDACRVAGRSVMGEPLRTRLLAARRDVLLPRFTLAAGGAGESGEAAAHDFDAEPFGLELKDFFAMPQLPHIFSHVAPASAGSKFLYAFNDPLRRLAHGNDGIIFTPARDPYRPYTCPALIKWKPANMNSIDFKLCRRWRTQSGKTGLVPRFMLLVAQQTMTIDYDWITFSEEEHERFASDRLADTRIVECVFDPSWPTERFYPGEKPEDDRTWDHPVKMVGGWRFERVREDKKLPNDISTVRSIEVSVRDGVSGAELLHGLRPFGLNMAAAVGSAFVPNAPQGQPQTQGQPQGQPAQPQ